MIKEWNLLRTVACLSVVLLHTTTQIGRSIGYPNIDSYYFLRILLTYATPTFIVLSEVILANKYNNRIPEGFFTKRIKLIIFPFIIFAVIDALVVNYISANGIDITQKIISNLTGNFIGYFILIIFQFYILHYLIIKFNISVLKLFPISIFVMYVHLWAIQQNFPFINEHATFFKLFFTAWGGYFTIAFLIGKEYQTIAKFLYKYRWLTVVLLFYIVMFLFASYEGGNTRVDSRRLDIFPLSVGVSLFVLAWGQKLANFNFINIISNYSLGIYLLHWQVQRIITPYLTNKLIDISPHIQIIVLFTLSVVISMLIIKLISFLPFGKYIVGNTRRTYVKV
ncbi:MULTISPECIES: acyltransferase family protein [Allobacillus]|nr:acyltransferase family protein [Allobacillus salarius]